MSTAAASSSSSSSSLSLTKTRERDNTTTITTPTSTSPNTNKKEKDDYMNNEEFLEALDDVHSRFILNLPMAELSSSDRIFFQLEQAFWFYEDFYCNTTGVDGIEIKNTNKNIPKFKYLYPFAQKMFYFSPLLKPLKHKFNEMWKDFSSYKRSISTYGTILINDDCTKVILCQDWYGKSWTFPAGKVNENETGIEAASRETYEETGFDVNCIYGDTSRKPYVYNQTWTNLREEDALVYTEDYGGPSNNKRRTCYVCKSVPDDFDFNPVARKEVSQVCWIELKDLTTYKTFAVLPFVNQLRRWIRKNTNIKNTALDSIIAQYKKQQHQGDNNSRANSRAKSRTRNQEITTPNTKKSSKKSKMDNTNNSRSNSRPNSTSKKRNNTISKQKINPNDIFLGDTDGWSEKDMFLTNEKLLGRKVEYDGNPHEFWNDKSDDPHKFHIVGGAFMNSSSKKSSSPLANKPLPISLFQNSNDNSNADDDITTSNDDDDPSSLKPFFSNDGKTPWGEIVHELPSSNNKTIDFQHLTTEQVRQQIVSIESTLDTLPKKQQNIKNKKSKSHKQFNNDNQHWDSLLHWVETFSQISSSNGNDKNPFKFDRNAIIHAMNVAVIKS